ncbi:MAG: hypothetical protein PHQ43_08705 [Dehalococcoidales bacterium]|nr:hypothetical protein [Dehalococcoidales bacterium]
MARTYANIRDAIEQKLQDTSNAIFSTTEIDAEVKDCLRVLAEYVPYMRFDDFEIIYKYGNATETLASHLVDDSNEQFESGDIGKLVWNRTDRTFAQITAYTDAGDVTLSSDIFTVGESYAILHKNCSSERDINIEAITDHVGVNHGVRFVEYPIMCDPPYYRNYKIIGDILTLDVRRTMQDNYKVRVHYAGRHRVSQLTDFAGAVDLGDGYAAGSTSMVIDGLQATGTIEEGQEFTVANLHGVYRVTEDATIASNEATVSFFPGLSAAVANDAVVTLLKSSLTPTLEDCLIRLTAARCAMSKAVYVVDKVNTGHSPFERYYTWGKAELESVMRDLRRMRERRIHQEYPDD